MAYFFVPVLILGVDQLSKQIIRKRLKPEERQPLGHGWELWRRENPGISYGHLGQRPTAVKVVTALICLILALLFFRSKAPAEKLGLGLAAAGGTGNLIDRCRQGTVTDFLHYRNRRCPVFNLADCSIFFGTLLIFFAEIRKG